MDSLSPLRGSIVSGAHENRAAPGAIRLANALSAADETRGRKVRPMMRSRTLRDALTPRGSCLSRERLSRRRLRGDCAVGCSWPCDRNARRSMTRRLGRTVGGQPARSSFIEMGRKSTVSLSMSSIIDCAKTRQSGFACSASRPQDRRQWSRSSLGHRTSGARNEVLSHRTSVS